MDIVRKENWEEFLLRKFVLENRNLEAHEILASLLERHSTGVQRFENIGAIDIKRIQNIKEQLAGQISRNAVQSIIPHKMATIDNEPFLVFQAVKPVILIFATKESMTRVRTSRTCALLKLPVFGPTLKYVYCFYTFSDGSVVPGMWVMFDEEGSGMAWTQVMALMEKGGEEKPPLSRLWIVPCSNKYMQALGNFTRPDDSVRGIDASFTRRLKKICDKVEDEAKRLQIYRFFFDLAGCTVMQIKSTIAQVKKHCHDPVGRSALAEWCRCFNELTFMYPFNVRCNDPALAELYGQSKEGPVAYQTDEEIIALIRQKYKDGQSQ